MTIPIKILFLAANPRDMDPLQLNQESRAIDLALRGSAFRDRFELEDHWAVQVSDLQDLLLRHEPHILHFSGHGTEENEIVLMTDGNGIHPISAANLADLLAHFTPTLRCVVLNACYSEPQAREIAEAVDCVVGISGLLSDQDAITFSAAFYRSLGYGKDIQTALAMAQTDVSMHDNSHQFAPALIALNSDPASIRFVEPIQPRPEPSTSETRHPTADGGESPHPVLQEMASQTPNMMMVILAIAIVGMMMIIIFSVWSQS